MITDTGSVVLLHFSWMRDLRFHTYIIANTITGRGVGWGGVGEPLGGWGGGRMDERVVLYLGFKNGL